MQQHENILEVRGISKSFGAVRALKDVSFRIRRGEIHALLGENGAGKSTLIKVLSGEHTPDSGSVFVCEEQIKTFHPLVSHDAGITVVHQELSIFENLTVFENIFPYREGKHRLIPKKELIEKVKREAKRFDLKLDPCAKMGDLRLSVQQMVEILRALSENAKIVLLDEPTSGLNTQETANLMRILKKLRDDGITIIYISHRISEIMEISDRVTVLRDGTYINTFENDAALTENMLISSMVGRDFEKSIYSKKHSEVPADAQIVFEARAFTKGKTVVDASLSVRRGEIMGVFGLEGSGTYEFSRMMFGLHGRDGGRLFFEGREIKRITPTALIEKGVIFLNNNRKDAGLLFNMSIADNLAVPVVDKLTRRGFLSRKALEAYSMSFVNQFSIVLHSIYDKPNSLSGGNQQKVMLSVCLGTKPKFLIVNEPTRGIDVGAKLEILNLLNKIVQSGVSILCFSSDLPELITLSDRIAVMNTGRVAGVIECDDISENSVMQLAAMDMLKEGAC
jgi:ABC-type sugar transport system ATPase subunit